MKYSFKFKIALISLLITGTLLTAFGGFFFAFAYHAGIERMDQEIRTLTESSLRGPRLPNYWEDFDRSLQFIYGEQAPARIALYVVDSDERVPFKSDNAPPELADMILESTGEVSDREGHGDEPPLLKRLDLNMNGLVSADEFDGPRGDFADMDMNGDGFIAAEEASEWGGGPMPPPRHREPPMMGKPVFKTLETAQGDWRVGICRSPEQTVLMAMDMEVFYQDINRFRTAFLIAVPAGLIVLAFTGWFLADRAMRPVSIIADTAEGITAKGLDRRIPMVGRDIEIERLVSVFNHMLDRLEKGYQQAVRFSADAAHELQTPLTILQGELDNAIQSAEAGSAEQQRSGMLLEELSNLKSVVQKLLLLAHADEGRLKLNAQPVDLSELICSAAEDLEVMAPALKVELSLPGAIHTTGDSALLNQAVRNMVSNAAKYTSEGGTVLFSLEQEERQVCFTLANTAPQIPDEDRPLLFKRFHRVEKSRTTAGSGLGLSLAREIARAHDGDLVLNSYHDGKVSFSLTLPTV